jgi:hypothetical protein
MTKISYLKEKNEVESEISKVFSGCTTCKSASKYSQLNPLAALQRAFTNLGSVYVEIDILPPIAIKSPSI